jgi:hypothetical protein
MTTSLHDLTNGFGTSPAAPPVPPPELPPPPADDYDTRALGMLLRIADSHRAANAVRQAIEMYFSILEKYANLPESRKARERLLEIAEEFEGRGQLRQARALVERLL